MSLSSAPRRSRLRRGLRVGLLLGLGLGVAALLLAAFAFVFLHTPQGTTAAQLFVELWASRATGGRVRLGRLDLAYFVEATVPDAIRFFGCQSRPNGRSYNSR